MKKVIALALAGIWLCSSGWARTAKRSADTTEEGSLSVSSDSTALSTGLDGKWGLGFDTIQGANSGGALSASPNAVDLRWWKSDVLALEGLVALNITNPSPGTGESIFGLGVGAKYNWRKPVEDVLVQWVGRFSFATDNSGGSNNTTVAVQGGSAFEAFIPAWKALSVEGMVALGFISQNKPSGTSTLFGITGNGFVPVTVAVHYYF
jgi:hypothetical protein